MADYYAEQRLRLAQKLLEQQGTINDLRGDLEVTMEALADISSDVDEGVMRQVARDAIAEVGGRSAERNRGTS